MFILYPKDPPGWFIGTNSILNPLLAKNSNGFSVIKLKLEGTWSGVMGKCAPSIWSTKEDKTTFFLCNV